MEGTENSPARERVLTVAERLFSERGYATVTLQDIAGQLGMRKASLYNHAPGGKEQLYVEVMERNLARHQHGIEAALTGAEPRTLRAQLRAVSRWLLSQPAINVARMQRIDMPEITPEHATRLMGAAYQALMVPIERAVEAAYRRGDIRFVNGALVAGIFLTNIEAIRDLYQYDAPEIPLEVVVDDAIDILLDGLHRR
ncbi:MAG: TetR/AcrR family transcriptional regulator [Chloroflexaceae bacterium]|nr:TetR/AcrR family transcriptional regulator [Chloroflexaceae bacterium]NJL33225.1 TetR/AcrR family transcriptional regulator [Chloroflexaceae bacterium]NJO05528.1 TetR/AcrR family transcriptional regulator [Chloroflexaceae bacterium]